MSIVGRHNEEVAIRKNHIDVVGTVSNVGGKNIDVSYSIDNESFTTVKGRPFSGLAVGEEFYTMVKKTNYNSILVFYSRPILDTTKYTFAYVSPTDIDRYTFSDVKLKFSYIVGDEEYDRIQEYEEGERPDDFSKLIVKYRVDKPRIGYLVLLDGQEDLKK